MTFFEPPSFPLASVIDTNGPDELPLGATRVGTGLLRSLSTLTHDELSRIAAQTYILSNSMFTHNLIFPDWLKISRFWIPGIVVGQMFPKPKLIYSPFEYNNETLHKSHYRALINYYRENQCSFHMQAETCTMRWHLVLEREAFEVRFVSPFRVDTNFTPPFISINSNEFSSKSSESPKSGNVPPV